MNINSTNVNVNGTMTIPVLNVTSKAVISGTLTEVNTENLAVKDNIIEINKGETGTGVTLGKAGIKVDRGDSNAQFIIFDESDDKFKIGENSNLENIATENYVSNLVDNKVDKDGDKMLSDNNFTDTYKTKLDGVEDNAETNKIDTVKVDGSALQVTNKSVNIDISGKLDKDDVIANTTTTELGKALDASIGNELAQQINVLSSTSQENITLLGDWVAVTGGAGAYIQKNNNVCEIIIHAKLSVINSGYTKLCVLGNDYRPSKIKPIKIHNSSSGTCYLGYISATGDVYTYTVLEANVNYAIQEAYII